MRRAVYTETGPSSVLRMVEGEAPTPGHGEVRVRMVRAGVNPTDWKFRAGVTSPVFDEVSPGQDGAGVVDAVGPEVEGHAVGDRVWVYLAQHGRPYGTAGELVVVPSERVVTLPPAASFDVGASLGVPALTAHRALTCLADGPGELAPGALDGRTVLVAGGAGAVGNAGIQLARWAGATVVTTVSSDGKAALATAAGAHHTIDYRQQDVEHAARDLCPEGVDLVVEVAPATNNPIDLAVLKSFGTVAIYANNGGDALTIPVRQTFSKNLRYQFILLYGVQPSMLAAGARAVNRAIGDGAFGVGEDHGVPLHHYALEDIGSAHDAVEQGAVGKVLLDVADETSS